MKGEGGTGMDLEGMRRKGDITFFFLSFKFSARGY